MRRHVKADSMIAAITRTQDWIDRSESGSPDRAAAVEQMQAIQKIIARRLSRGE